MSWFTEENSVFNTAIMVSDASSHPSHLWNLKNISIIFGWRGDKVICWCVASPPSHCSTYSSLLREIQLCTEQTEARWEGGNQLLLARVPLYHLNMSLGVSTYLIPVSRTPDMHCHTSSLQSSGMELVWLVLTAAVISLLASVSWVSTFNNSSSKFVIQFGSTIKIQQSPFLVLGWYCQGRRSYHSFLTINVWTKASTTEFCGDDNKSEKVSRQSNPS